MAYTHPLSPVPYQLPLFPLPIVYALLFFLLFSLLYILSTFIRIKGFIGHIGLIAFGTILLIFEFLSGKTDIFVQYVHINMNQLLSLLLIGAVSYSFFHFIKESSLDRSATILSHKH
jgi:prolipoprotein diacylglyceryltransferase